MQFIIKAQDFVQQKAFSAAIAQQKKQRDCQIQKHPQLHRV